jgi:DNA (cytosine-5)-methyltransferase 1
MSRPRLLDLFGGAGGAAMGYYRAGFDVVGVDNRPQPRYPFQFHQADAMTFPLDGYDAVHASPPCQDYSKNLRHQASGYARLIEATRDRLRAAAVPWVIENVEGAPLPSQADLFGAYGAELCGTMFGLRIWRHRLFEASHPVSPPRGCDHTCRPLNPYRQSSRALIASIVGGEWHEQEEPWRAEMGVPWMSRDEGREAIPPAYTEHIGAQLLDHLKERAA